MKPGKTRTRLRTLIASAIAAALMVTLTVAPASARPADYPTWAEVERARKSEAATKELVNRLRAEIARLTEAAAAAQELAEQRGNEYAVADVAFQEASYTASVLEEDLVEAELEAAESRRLTGNLIAALARSGGGNMTATILARAAEADDLLGSLAALARMTEITDALTDQAVQDKNTVEAITAQAQVARDKREELREIAEAALEEAQKAAAEADAALTRQSASLAQLEAQLAVLVERRRATERDYAAGQAAQAGQGGPPGKVSSSGWANPTAGRITSPFGYRIHPITKVRAFHAGVDIAGGCNMPIYAARSGTVSYSGWYGTYGNFIVINHGNGVQTAYAHIRDGGRLVGVGARVTAGQVIARTGTTGASTGCHLQFEVRVNGGVVDPVPFMRDRGVRLG